jgi:hypothetical protein
MLVWSCAACLWLTPTLEHRAGVAAAWLQLHSRQQHDRAVSAAQVPRPKILLELALHHAACHSIRPGKLPQHRLRVTLLPVAGAAASHCCHSRRSCTAAPTTAAAAATAARHCWKPLPPPQPACDAAGRAAFWGVRRLYISLACMCACACDKSDTLGEPTNTLCEPNCEARSMTPSQL